MTSMPLNYDKLMSMTFEPQRTVRAEGHDPLCARPGRRRSGSVRRQELKYVYEKDLVALPTLAVTLAAGAMRLADPEFGINYRMLLHAEQSLQMHKPLPVEGTVVSEAKIDEIYDKGAARARSCT